MLPDRARLELMESMSCFGACGFHVARWQDAFVRCAASVGIDAPATFVSPLGADAARLDEVAATEACRSRLGALEDDLDGRTLMLRSDRVELSKNLIRGFLAFDELLESSPRLAGPGRLPGARLRLARVPAGVPRLPDRDRARRRAG